MSDEETEDLTAGPGRRGSGATGVVAMVLPFATAIAALALGAILGIFIGWMLAPSGEKVEVPGPPRDLNAAELLAACAPALETKVSELEEAQGKVQFLEKEVSDREVRVKELEDEMKRRNDRGKNFVAEFEQAKRDLEEARVQLDIARQEKEQLVIELTQTKEELAKTEVALVEQKGMTERAKEDALVNKWYRFNSEAQLEVCEKGNRKKLGGCREVLQGTLMTNLRRDKFAHCVRSAQAIPTVRELQKGESLPDFAEMIDEEQKQTKGWYVLFCDPTLPEKPDGFLNEEHIPPKTASGTPSP